MDLSAIEECVRQSSIDGPNKAAAIQELHKLKSMKECTTIGLKLFFESQKDMVKFFGLSLIRESLSNPPFNQDGEERRVLRESVYKWIERALQTDLQNIPPHYFNQMITIITLCIKSDYPEGWPTAFQDFLNFGRLYGFNGVDVLIRILTELEIEVVMFSEGRTKEEIAHNTLIKDTMRGTNAISEIIQFLSSTGQTLITTVYSGPNNSLNRLSDLTSRCLLCLAEMIGWVDIQLIINFAFPTIVSAITSGFPTTSSGTPPSCLPTIRKAGLNCVFELAKKGMDPWLKIPMLHSLQLLPFLHSIAPKHTLSAPSPATTDDDEDGIEVEKQLGFVVDMVLLEGIGCYAKLEELVVMGSTTVSAEEVEQMYRIVVPILHSTMQLFLSLILHPQVSVACTLTPSIIRFIHFLKSQKSATARREGAFIGQDYVPVLLPSFLTQARYPKDFPFALCEVEQEDIWEISEGKKEFTRYFSNLCRLYPTMGEQLLVQQLQSLAPFSQANVYELECCLRLLYHYAEACVNTSELNESHAFIALLVALHDAQILQHPHEQVMLAYYELMMKYGKYCPLSVFHSTVDALLQSILAQHKWSADRYYVEVRSKCVNFVYRLMESSHQTNGYTLLGIVEQRMPEILATNTQQIWMQHSNNNSNGSPLKSRIRKINLLSDHSVLQLYEVINLVITAFLPPNVANSGEGEGLRTRQVALFRQTLAYVLQYFQFLLGQPVGGTAGLPVEAMEGYLAQEIAHLALLLKHLPCQAVYLNELPAILHSMQALSNHATAWLANSSLLRQKVVLLCHPMLLLSPGLCADLFSALMSFSLPRATLDELDIIVAFTNQVVNHTTIVPAVDLTTCESHPDYPRLWSALQSTFPVLLQHNLQLLHDFEQATTTGATADLPSFEAERVGLLKPWLSFLSHLAAHPLHLLFLSLESHTFDQLLDMILLVAKGYTPFGKPISKSQAIPLKRLVYVFVMQLAHQWDPFVLSQPPQQQSPRAAMLTMQHPNVQRFTRFVDEQWLPLQLVSIGHPLSEAQIGGYLTSLFSDYAHLKVSMKDAQTQSLLVEIASMLFTKAHPLAPTVTSREATNYAFGQYLTNLLIQQLRWSDNDAHQLLAQLYVQPIVPLGTFRDQFKAFVRKKLN